MRPLSTTSSRSSTVVRSSSARIVRVDKSLIDFNWYWLGCMLIASSVQNGIKGCFSNPVYLSLSSVWQANCFNHAVLDVPSDSGHIPSQTACKLFHCEELGFLNILLCCLLICVASNHCLSPLLWLSCRVLLPCAHVPSHCR